MALHGKRGTAVAALVLGASLALVGCSGAVVAEGGGSANRTLIFDLGLEMTSLDPAQIFDVSASTVDQAIYEGLVNYKPGTGDIEPVLAEDWEVNDDSTEYTFKLKEGITFESGGTLTSSDVEFAYNRLKNLQGAPSYLMDGLEVRADGDHSVIISSDEPRPELPAMLASSNFAVYDSQAIIEAGGVSDETAATEDAAGAIFAERSFGTGVYTLESYEPNAEVNLTFSDNWRGDEPDFTRVIIRDSRSMQQQMMNIQNGGADVTISLASPQVADLDASKVNVMSEPLPQVIYFALTNSGGPTVDANYREAIALGLDYEGLVQVAGEGGLQGTSVIPSSVPGSLPKDDVLKRDVEGAKAALAASGMSDQELTISFGSDYTVGGQDMGLFAQKIQSDLEEIGMTVVLDGAPTQVSRTANQEGKLQAALWPFPPDFVDPSQFLIYSPGGLLAERIHWTPDEAPEIVALAETARVLPAGPEREAAYQDWARAVRATNRFISVVEVPQNLVTSKRVGNLNVDVAGNVSFETLTLETK